MAIPINRARRVAEEILRYGRIREVWWGFRLEEVSPAVARSLGLQAKQGLLVAATFRNSAAARAGLEPGDLITGINGEEIVDTRDFLIATANVRVGDRVVLDVTRGTETIQIEFTVEEASQ